MTTRVPIRGSLPSTPSSRLITRPGTSSGGGYSVFGASRFFASLAEDARRLHLVETLVAKRRAPGEDQEASICIGSRATFERPPSVASNIVVNFPQPPDEGNDGAPCVNALAYTYVTHKSHKIRVENPDDPEQYVMVERLDTVCFEGPDKRQHNFDLTPLWQALEGATP